MTCKSTIIFIGVGRQAIDSYIRNDRLVFSEISPELEGVAEVVEYVDHHGKRVLTILTDKPPLEAVRALIRHYPHLRVNMRYENPPVCWGIIYGEKGKVTKERHDDSPPKFPVKN